MLVSFALFPKPFPMPERGPEYAVGVIVVVVVVVAVDSIDVKVVVG